MSDLIVKMPLALVCLVTDYITLREDILEYL